MAKETCNFYGLQNDHEDQNRTQPAEKISALTISNDKHRIIPTAITNSRMNKNTKNNNYNRSEVTINRLQLFATVKILLKFLAKEKPHLRFVAQRVLKDCQKQHQSDKSSKTTLAELIERRLRETVGEKSWRIARSIQKRECSISLKSIDAKSKRSEFTVRGTNNNMITLIVPLAASNNNTSTTAVTKLELK